MPTQHDAITSMAQFRRALAIVLVGFALVLALSWLIDGAIPHAAQGSVASGRQLAV